MIVSFFVVYPPFLCRVHTRCFYSCVFVVFCLEQITFSSAVDGMPGRRNSHRTGGGARAGLKLPVVRSFASVAKRTAYDAFGGELK